MSSVHHTAAWRDRRVVDGLRDAVALFLPVIPFALVLGLVITESAMPAWVGWSSNVIVYAGAAQLAMISLASTATWLTLVATGTVINLRHVMYSAALAPRFAEQPRWFRWVGPSLLIDQLFAQLAGRDDLDPRSWRRYYLAAGIFYIVTWTVCVSIGMVIGSAIPTEWRLDVTPAIMFASLVAIGITSAPGLAAASVGAGVCLLCLDVPNNGGILIGAVCGVLAGYLADTARSRRSQAPTTETPTSGASS